MTIPRLARTHRFIVQGCLEEHPKVDVDYNFKRYDAIIIDYGIMGEDKYMFQEIYNSGAKMAWCGAMACRYNEDAKRLMPKLKFLHKLPVAELGEIGWLMDYLFKEEV